ncbi:MAG: proteasome assembly chaperone family protein [Haloferacaceae archaeon]
MARIAVQSKGIELDEPTLIEGFPGVGLVGKIAADHLVDEFDMTHYADLYCDGLPSVATYGSEEPDLRTAVRLYADEERSLVVLQSDVPVAPDAAETVAGCLAGWLDENAITPVYLSGLPTEKDEAPPEMYGVATGDGGSMLSEAGIGGPAEAGMVSGPTGALLLDALETGRTAVGLVVETDPRFPDPEAANVLLSRGVEPLTGVSVPTDDLVDRAEEIRKAREELAKRMQEGDEESTQAQPLRMYQ